MSWIVLVGSGVLEAVWATALGRSDGLSRLAPTVVFAVALVTSMVGLAWAMRELPTGTAYAVWVGIGATLTAAWAMAQGEADPNDRWTRRARPTFLYVMYLLLLWSIPMGLLAGVRPAMAAAMIRGMAQYLSAIPEPLPTAPRRRPTRAASRTSPKPKG